MHRKAVVEGVFYPKSFKAIKNFVDSCNVKLQVEAKIAIVPHAGYIYSGETAVKTLKSINKIEKNIILLGPNHTGLGEKVAVFPEGEWQTPCGDVAVNKDTVDLLVEKSVILKRDTMAHIQEHSLEVLLPILKYLKDDINIVPITVSHLTKNECFNVAKDIYEIIKDGSFTIVVSTDFNHFESEEVTNYKDKLAIEKILDIDPEGLYNIVFEKRISMCGIFPVTIALYLARMLNLNNVKLAEHTTSARASGDYNRVVGYAGILIG
ncbi:MAG: hypothetical protein JG762_1049 [Deferribacteraceae bacterium]|jgi:AmmeMemoRadiSam system protein B|nr:hypothetical protein [Deferribacteraceae bacterium]